MENAEQYHRNHPFDPWPDYINDESDVTKFQEVPPPKNDTVIRTMGYMNHLEKWNLELDWFEDNGFSLYEQWSRVMPTGVTEIRQFKWTFEDGFIPLNPSQFKSVNEATIANASKVGIGVAFVAAAVILAFFM